MRKKILKRVVCCLCAAVMVLGGLPTGRQEGKLLEVQAAQESGTKADKAEIPAVPQNLRYEEGFIVWDEVSDAYGYTLRVFSGDSERSYTYYVNKVELDRFCYENEMDFGSYKFDVCAFNESRESSAWSNQVSAGYEPTLETPNVRVEDSSVTWDEVEGAVRYNVRVFNDDDNKTLDYSTYTSSNQYTYWRAGSYWVSVQAVDREYNVSIWTESVKITIDETVEKDKLETPSNIRFDESGENILWDAVKGADYYHVSMCSYFHVSYIGENMYYRDYATIGYNTAEEKLDNWKSYVHPAADLYILEINAYTNDGEYSGSDTAYSEEFDYSAVRDETIKLPESVQFNSVDGVLSWDKDDSLDYWFLIKYNGEYCEADKSYSYSDSGKIEKTLSLNSYYYREDVYDIELFVVDENNNYNSKTYSVMLDREHDETIWVPEVFYKFDDFLWDYDRLRHEDTTGFVIRVTDIKNNSAVEYFNQYWENCYSLLYGLPNGKYIIEVCVIEERLGPWSKPLTVLKHEGGLFDEENKSTEEIITPPEAADIPDDDKITSVTINPAFNMKHKDGNNVELDLSKIKVKANAIYDEEGLKRVEEALGQEIKGNKHYNLLDLTLLYDGKDFSNGYEGLVQVIIPLPAGHRDKTFSCYRLTKVDGKTVKEKINGEQTKDSYIIYLEHFSEYVLVGAGEEEEHNHVYDTTWKNDENSHWKECDCGEKSENAEHIYGEWFVTKSSTESETGLKERNCKICGYKQTEEIPKITGNKENSSSDASSADEPDDEDETDTKTSDILNAAANNTGNIAGNNNASINTGSADNQNSTNNPTDADDENSISAATGDMAGNKVVMLYILSVISGGMLLLVSRKKRSFKRYN